MNEIPIFFNKPFYTGKENRYIREAVKSGKISGNGQFTEKCQAYFKVRYDFNKCLLTTSCTDALEMAAILINIKQGDEVIMPSFTFVSTANAFVLRGAKIIFCDSHEDQPNIDENKIELLISERTKAIVVVHYAGNACNMNKIMNIASKYGLFVIEDAAQAIDNFYIDPNGTQNVLGSIGHLSTFSFHETKNIIAGEGGMLVINDDQFSQRAEIIWEKGTNRTAFFKGEIDKYGWVDIGSSFLPSEIITAFLYAQLENIDLIQKKRKKIWNRYYKNLKLLESMGLLKLPILPSYSTNNAHMFYILTRSETERKKLIEFLSIRKIYAVSHYISLNRSEFYLSDHREEILKNSDKFSVQLLRLPFFFELSMKQVDYICSNILEFYKDEISKNN